MQRNSGRFDVFTESVTEHQTPNRRSSKHKRNSSVLECLTSLDLDSPKRGSRRSLILLKSPTVQEEAVKENRADENQTTELPKKDCPLQALAEIDMKNEADEVEVEYEPLIVHPFASGETYRMFNENAEISFQVKRLDHRHRGVSVYDVMIDHYEPIESSG
mmetsp:Transcript_352/g.1184  ORF Transcript_352/g.1184 Transcript_352/m.1184 type:complete len:161 (-) Transcript_352:167-649(-)|eukprot:CAMPEP_0198729162 /NCGR_PEP_ID=MMETSP1475-20131203/15103_1 /TAXON_ID= ORGANISM="Unidentified sp., Strain CCMP1999" /NCGR_SAMPLE_ID=MMETSP1475 /ASSEMBLY_ACC=CAM_ASM_001111 /LENGTH=160 /DNA_ID=CAMNT_0044491735 /DNA_START=45 /DNA_END=527 /DNA_ORIENTATION=+